MRLEETRRESVKRKRVEAIMMDRKVDKFEVARFLEVLVVKRFVFMA